MYATRNSRFRAAAYTTSREMSAAYSLTRGAFIQVTRAPPQRVKEVRLRERQELCPDAAPAQGMDWHSPVRIGRYRSATNAPPPPQVVFGSIPAGFAPLEVVSSWLPCFFQKL